MRIITTLIFITTALFAQIPNGYYTSATGQSGATLHQTLHDIIDDHQQQSYSSLHTHYYSTDRKPDGTVWDMYSDVPGGTPPYTFNFNNGETCGNYSGEGDCYNREHSWPKSWFNNEYPMYSDLFHVVPSDGYVNGQRGNYPYGEVDSPNWTSLNGSKRGPNAYPGYTGTVFEPIDAYKGDFARIYFYMSTRYLNEDSGWSGSPMVDGAQLEPWALDMMMEWHTEDPVSQKEIDRNDAVYTIQQNRNPFVDHPEYVDLIWGEAIPVPAAPSDLAVSNITETSLDLNWTDNASDETGFYLYQDNARIATLTANSESFSVANLQASTTYSFAVAAYNGGGESARISITVSTSGGGGSTVTHFSEDFESGSGSTYIEGDLTLNSGQWNVYQAGNFSLGTPRSGSKSIAINDDKDGAHITTPAVNSLGTLSFWYYQRNGASTDEFVIQKSVDGSSFETLTTQNYNVGETYTLFTLDVNDSSESVRMRIVNDNQAAHLVIDDLTVTQYGPSSTHELSTSAPASFSLNPAYPNPFNPEVHLSFNVENPEQEVALEIFDLRGELIAWPAQGFFPVGTNHLTWSGTSNRGEIPAGIYLVRLSAGNFSQFQRITLLK